MKRVYKFGPLSIGVENKVPMPAGAEILDAAFQRDSVYLWALVDTMERRQERRGIFVAMTGPDIIGGNPMRHIRTILSEDRSFVLHVFEVQPPAGGEGR